MEHQKIIEIYKLLFEIAIGNQSEYRPKKPAIAELDGIFNMLLEINITLKKYIEEYKCYNPFYTYQSLTQYVFILNNKFQVINSNSEALSFLKQNYEDFEKLNFEKLITSQSITIWREITKSQTLKLEYCTTSRIVFKAANGKLFPKVCTISRLSSNNCFIVTSLTVSNREMIKFEEDWVAKNNNSVNEFNVIHKLHEIIMNNLDQPLPPLKSLARVLGSEEHILKVGFRKYFGTSVYQFYQDERLKKAEQLILQTSISLKEIAFMCGFLSYLNFYKAFKKKYNYAPSDLNRNTSQILKD